MDQVSEKMQQLVDFLLSQSQDTPPGLSDVDDCSSLRFALSQRLASTNGYIIISFSVFVKLYVFVCIQNININNPEAIECSI